MSDKSNRGRKAGVKTVPTNESKNGKFVRLGNKRLAKVLNGIRQLKNLSASTYESTPAQIEYITGKLDVAVADIKTAFAGKTTSQVEKIELPQ